MKTAPKVTKPTQPCDSRIRHGVNCVAMAVPGKTSCTVHLKNPNYTKSR